MSIAFIALAVITANPSTVDERLADARPGDTVVLRGNFDRIKLPERSWSPALTIDAEDARIDGVTLHNVSGVNWRGGNVKARFGPDAIAASSYAFAVRNAAQIRIEDVRIRNANRGVVVADSRDVVLSGLDIGAMSIDGVNVAGSDDVTLEKSVIGPFKPPYMTNSGPVHADGFQAWNGNTRLRIIDNLFRGNMAGIVDFGRPGETPDNIGTLIEGNRIRVAHTHGISITMTRRAIVRDNIIESGKSATRSRGTILRLDHDTEACGNTVEDMPDSEGTRSCNQRPGDGGLL